MDEQPLRERLRNVADDVTPIGSVPSGLVHRARRRALLVPTVGALVAIAIATASFVGVRSLVRSERGTPAVPVPTVSSVVPTEPAEDHVTVVLSDDDRPHAVVAADPDGEPAGAAQLPVPDGSIPLAWSPDGRLLFTDADAGGLHALGADGAIVELASGAIYGASFSPDGSEIVYAVGTFGDTTLRVLDLDAPGGPRDEALVRDATRMWNAAPSWSPDGRTIAFLRGDPDPAGCDETCEFVGDRDLEVWLVERDGSDLRPLAPGLHARGYHAPSWSPDGTRLAVAAYDDRDEPQVIVIELGTGERRQVSSSGGRAPAWSPDGGRIAFAVRDGARWVVHLVDADGTDERLLLTPPVWSSTPVLWDLAPPA